MKAHDVEHGMLRLLYVYQLSIWYGSLLRLCFLAKKAYTSD